MNKISNKVTDKDLFDQSNKKVLYVVELLAEL